MARNLATIKAEVAVVGHSLGASFLLKYLSEEKQVQPISGVFLIAPPYWGAEDWEVDEYLLCEDFESRLPDKQNIIFYHSRDDQWVPFTHLAMYAQKLPKGDNSSV
ncbi:hypothetical protein CVD19_02545 [Bacillus sp. T33-2]|nr:hypothetical protein CVD19_02545 [Bacillus sp. T33-2]